MSLEIRSENKASQWTSIEERILSLDPGVRTFSTNYSPSGLAKDMTDEQNMSSPVETSHHSAFSEQGNSTTQSNKLRTDKIWLDYVGTNYE
ncbi:23653_t:CDS:2 [Gigaspora margarita]|uniref:23653_t:CDS:1 n=1 Tax=Gigaspora margarita TaxID=4874 RepID=A0ABN7VZX9_GIGMA|nr:23653_t:CDS:2 [Gigaspora margarita]